jgi:membrane-bound lytic murein transglycosylase C
MKKFCLVLFVLPAVTLTAPNLLSNDMFEKLSKDWEIQMNDMEREWEETIRDIDRKWSETQKEQEEKWNRLKIEVERKWQEFDHSTPKNWVGYSTDKDVRSHVDFEEGKILLEAVLPENDPEAEKKVMSKIRKQIEKMLCEKDLNDHKILNGQLVTSKGDKVESKNLEKYLKKEVLPKIKPDPKPFDSRDGVKRRKYTVSMGMVPEHIRIRADKYLPTVEKNARRFNLKPQLVMAIIQTESYFNPMAVSSRNAIGIMQIIPEYAGREAYKALYGEDKVLSWEYLFVPENNIEMGCVYLSLLKHGHFRDVQGDMKNIYVSICGYNWGPTSMRKKIVDKYPISEMNDNQVYALLRQQTPEETQTYIKRVTQRMPLYDPFF